MSIKFLVFFGGVFWVWGGGGSADFIFMGARIFLTKAILSNLLLPLSSAILTKGLEFEV